MKDAKTVALGGILTAVNLLLVYLASLLPTGRLFLLFAVAFLPQVLLYKRRVAAAVISYAATVLLSFLLISNPFYPLAYLLFFGLFPLIYHAAAHFSSRITEILLLLAFGSLSFLCLYLIFTFAIGITITQILPFWALALLCETALLLFVYLYSPVLRIFLRVLAPILKNW
jgi:hypothetical protein